MMHSYRKAKRCHDSIWDGHQYGYPHVGDEINLRGGKTCRVRRGVRLAMVNISTGIHKNSYAGGFVANTTLGERVALMRDRRYKRRVWREVSRESEWEK